MRDAAGDAKVVKYYGIAGQRVAVSGPEGMQYLLTNHLGSVSAVLDATGNLLSEQRYTPFDEARFDVALGMTDFGYTGHRLLAGTGLMDYNARFYAPALGRWTQPDTIVPGAANPQAYNRFSYVANGPLNFNDPSGHRLCEAITGDGCVSRPSTLHTQDRSIIEVGAAPDDQSIRIELANSFIAQMSESGSNIDYLYAELDFDMWIYSSDRMQSPWWNFENGYLVMSRFAGLEYLNSAPGTLTSPGVRKWAAYIEEPTAINFWIAHNTSITEARTIALQRGYYQSEVPAERELTQKVYINVIVVGETCMWLKRDFVIRR